MTNDNAFEQSSQFSLDDISVASPCSADWNKMTGDERVRFCGECKMNVYNLSGMSRKNAETLVQSTEGRLCVQYLRRSDGTIITRDCPVALHQKKIKATRKGALVAMTVMTLVGSFALLSSSKVLSQEGEASEELLTKCKKPVSQTTEPVKTKGEMLAPRLMGSIEAPPEKAPTKPNPSNQYIRGERILPLNGLESGQKPEPKPEKE